MSATFSVPGITETDQAQKKPPESPVSNTAENSVIDLIEVSMINKSLEFNLDAFEDFLTDKRIKIARVDLVMQVQRILKAEKNRGKVKIKEKEYRSCVSWKIDDYEIDLDDLIIDGEYKEVIKKENIESIDFEQ